MIESTTPLVFPALGDLYATLSPVAETALRVAVGLALVPHGLRMTFGFFPDSGIDMHSPAKLAEVLAHKGYRPPLLWARLISLTQLVGGPMLALGLLTRPVALSIFVFLAITSYERWRTSGYFWNTLGLEYPMLWSVAALFFVVHGGGLYSLDRLLIGREF